MTGEAMVIVHGAEHYVSPRWLPSLAEHGQVVPTWNYVTVRAAPTCSTRSHARTAAARQLEGLGRASAADVTDQWVVADMIRFMPPSARLPGTACGPTVQSSGRLPMTQL